MACAQDHSVMMSLVYVSRSLIDPRDRPDVLDDILAVATDCNSTLGISGLLLAAPDHFAQLLEGPSGDVEALMSRITADPRHTALRVTRVTQIDQPSCRRWRMARFDRGNFGGSIIGPMLMAAHTGDQAQAIARLDNLIDVIMTSQPA